MAALFNRPVDYLADSLSHQDRDVIRLGHDDRAKALQFGGAAEDVCAGVWKLGLDVRLVRHGWIRRCV